jgi:hypothetical protein
VYVSINDLKCKDALIAEKSTKSYYQVGRISRALIGSVAQEEQEIAGGGGCHAQVMVIN